MLRLPASLNRLDVRRAQVGERAVDVTFVLQLAQSPLLAFPSPQIVRQLVTDRGGTFERALIRKHREDHGPSIKSAQAEHGARGDMRPAKKFLPKERASMPHVF